MAASERVFDLLDTDMELPEKDEALFYNQVPAHTAENCLTSA